MAKIRLEVYKAGLAWGVRVKNSMGYVMFPEVWESRADALADAVRRAKEGLLNDQQAHEIYYESEGAFVLFPYANGHIP